MSLDMSFNREIYLRIILSALLHDIGKVLQRTGKRLSSEFFERNANLYLPFNKRLNKFTHLHALYTVYALEKELRDFIPDEFFRHTSDEDYLTNLAGRHHRPETPLELIIHEADCLSSGFERRLLDEESTAKSNKTQSSPREFLMTSIFEEVDLSENWKRRDEGPIFYEIERLNPKSIFPKAIDEILREKKSLEEYAHEKYTDLWEGFKTLLGALTHREKPELWLNHFVSLLMEYFTLVPSATRAGDQPGTFVDIWSDISLFDHLYFTASIASTLYVYHTLTDTLTPDKIRNRTLEKFILLEGNFYGIQNFIFAEGGSTRRYSAKILRGRSLMVSILSELCADYIIREFNLHSIAILINTAGKFLILLPNVAEIQNRLKSIENEINKWLYNRFYGETSIGLSMITFAPEKLLYPDGYEKLISQLGKKSEEKKYNKFDLYIFGGCPKNYFEEFSGNKVCDLCMRRPQKEVDPHDKELGMCVICADQKRLGENIVKKPFLAIFKVSAEKTLLKECYFNRYKISLLDYEELSKINREEILYIWDISIPGENSSRERSQEIYLARKFINGFVPRDEKEILTLEELAERALEEQDGRKTGVPALGVIKGDVDNLGTIFKRGFRPEKRTFSRFLTLSRLLDLFFAYYLPYLCNTRHPLIYNVFAGGDDLFVIGPWKQAISFIREVRKAFSEYTSSNTYLTISAGFLFTKPIIPVSDLAKRVEHYLELAKGKRGSSITGKNSISIFNRPDSELVVPWDTFEYLMDVCYTRLKEWYNANLLSRAFLYRLNEITEMAEEEKKILAQGKISLDRISVLLWRSKLYYYTVRNVATEIEKEERGRFLKEFLAFLHDNLQDYRGAIRIPLWYLLYETRRYSDE